MTDKTAVKKLYKSRKDKILDGVCGGIAEHFGIDPIIVRILWFLTFFVEGLGFWAYILSAVIVPPNPGHANLKEEEKKKYSPNMILGFVLISLGLMFLLRGFHLPWNYFRFPCFWNVWNIPWGIVLSCLLICTGVVYIIHVMRQDKIKENLQMSSDHDTTKRLYRPIQGRMIAGVCAAFADYFQIDPTWVRIAYAVLTILSTGFPMAIMYILLIFIIPNTPAEKN